jgi:hypothetical protein
MKTHQRFLITIFVFFLCLAPFSPLIAQGTEEKLPAIVKRIETSTVVILTYDEEVTFLPMEAVFSSVKTVMSSPIGM